MSNSRLKYPEMLVVKVKPEDKLRIRELSQRHDLSESVIIRKALAVGLKDFVHRALVAPAEAR